MNDHRSTGQLLSSEASPCSYVKPMGNTPVVDTQSKGPFTDEEFACVLQTFNKLKNPKNRLPKSAFVKHFHVDVEPHFAEALYCVFKAAPKVMEDPHDDPESLSFKEFFDNVSGCSRASDKNTLRVFFKVMDEDHDGKILRSQVKDFFKLAYYMSILAKGGDSCCHEFNAGVYAHQLRDVNLPVEYSPITSPEEAESPLSPAAGHDSAPTPPPISSPIDFDEFYVWASQTVPLLHLCFASFIYSRLCTCLPIPDALSFRLPQLRENSNIVTRDDQLFNLAAANAALQGVWQRLFTSEEHGLSFNRLCHYVLGYSGPNLLLVRDTKGYVFGFFTNESWKEGNTYFGSSDCFLFRLDPDFVLCRPKYGSNKHFMYLNLKGYALPHGLGVGGTVEGFRFFVPESLEGCTAGNACPTFEYGPLASTKVFELEAMEVWGVGGAAAIEAATSAQGKARQIMAENIDKARKVDKAKFAENEFDREMLLGKTFAGGSNQAGLRSDR